MGTVLLPHPSTNSGPCLAGEGKEVQEFSGLNFNNCPPTQKIVNLFRKKESADIIQLKILN
jgi:hypothetical protein